MKCDVCGKSMFWPAATHWAEIAPTTCLECLAIIVANAVPEEEDDCTEEDEHEEEELPGTIFVDRCDDCGEELSDCYCDTDEDGEPFNPNW
jgi:hypothetical protein